MIRRNTGERARGRWRDILPQLGIDSSFLKPNPYDKGPCPLCGGKDRFRFDDKEGSGSYFCNQCGPGVGIILIRKKRGCRRRRHTRRASNPATVSAGSSGC